MGARVTLERLEFTSYMCTSLWLKDLTFVFSDKTKSPPSNTYEKNVVEMTAPCQFTCFVLPQAKLGRLSFWRYCPYNHMGLIFIELYDHQGKLIGELGKNRLDFAKISRKQPQYSETSLNLQPFEEIVSVRTQTVDSCIINV